MEPAQRESFARRHPLVLFFLLANAISWLIWLPLVLHRLELIAWRPPQVLHLVGALGPMLAAFIVTQLVEGREGMRNLARRMTHWRFGIGWWIVALPGPLLLFALVVAATVAMGGSPPDMRGFGRSSEYADLPMALYWLANILFYGYGEETGWRGFALPYLQRCYGPLLSALVLSCFWAAWHLPLFAFAEGMRAMSAGMIVGWFFSLVTGSVILTWLYNGTRGSILAVALFHGVLDIVMTSPGVENVQMMMGVTITLLGLAIAGLWLVREPWRRTECEG